MKTHSLAYNYYMENDKHASLLHSNKKKAL
jgi:hypothetical protein